MVFTWLLPVSCMGYEIIIHMSGPSNDCLRVCNVKMKNFYRGGNGAHFREWLGYGAVASTDFKIFSWHLGYPSV